MRRHCGPDLCDSEVLVRRAAQVLLEPLHQCGKGALEIGGNGALEPVSRAVDSNERRGHARFPQRRVHRLSLVYGTAVSASPCTMSDGAEPGETKRMGENCAASVSVNLKTGCCVANRARSVAG